MLKIPIQNISRFSVCFVFTVEKHKRKVHSKQLHTVKPWILSVLLMYIILPQWISQRKCSQLEKTQTKSSVGWWWNISRNIKKSIHKMKNNKWKTLCLQYCSKVAVWSALHGTRIHASLPVKMVRQNIYLESFFFFLTRHTDLYIERTY